MRLRIFISFITFSILLNICYGQGPRVDVNTTRGPVFGYHFDQGNNMTALFYGQADIFLGIPYVKPPVNALRFQVISQEYYLG